MKYFNLELLSHRIYYLPLGHDMRRGKEWDGTGREEKRRRSSIDRRTYRLQRLIAQYSLAFSHSLYMNLDKSLRLTFGLDWSVLQVVLVAEDSSRMQRTLYY